MYHCTPVSFAPTPLPLVPPLPLSYPPHTSPTRRTRTQLDVAFRAACVESLGVLLELGVGGESKAEAVAWHSDQMEQRKKQVYKRGARLRESILFARNQVAAKTVRHIYREVNDVTRLLLCNVCTPCDGGQ